MHVVRMFVQQEPKIARCVISVIGYGKCDFYLHV